MIIINWMVIFTGFTIDGYISVIMFQVFRGIRWNNLIYINRHTLFNPPLLLLIIHYIIFGFGTCFLLQTWRNSPFTFKGNIIHSI